MSCYPPRHAWHARRADHHRTRVQSLARTGARHDQRERPHRLLRQQWQPRLHGGTVGALVSRRLVESVNVRALVATTVGLDNTVTGTGRTKRRCSLRSLPAILRGHVDAAIRHF